MRFFSYHIPCYSPTSPFPFRHITSIRRQNHAIFSYKYLFSRMNWVCLVKNAAEEPNAVRLGRTPPDSAGRRTVAVTRELLRPPHPAIRGFQGCYGLSSLRAAPFAVSCFSEAITLPFTSLIHLGGMGDGKPYYTVFRGAAGPQGRVWRALAGVGGKYWRACPGFVPGL